MVCATAPFLPTPADRWPAYGVCEVQNHSSLESTELLSLPGRGVYGAIPTDMQRLSALGVGGARFLATNMDPLTGMFCELHPKSLGKN